MVVRSWMRMRVGRGFLTCSPQPLSLTSTADGSGGGGGGAATRRQIRSSSSCGTPRGAKVASLKTQFESLLGSAAAHAAAAKAAFEEATSEQRALEAAAMCRGKVAEVRPHLEQIWAARGRAAADALAVCTDTVRWGARLADFVSWRGPGCSPSKIPDSLINHRSSTATQTKRHAPRPFPQHTPRCPPSALACLC